MKQEGVSDSAKAANEGKNPNSIFGGGEMGDRIREFDWSATSLGPLHSWPACTKSAVNLMLQSTAPLLILWGKEGIALYNTAYTTFAREMHPTLLGSSCPKVWPEAADFFQNVIDKTLQAESLSCKQCSYPPANTKAAEEVWVDLDCSPLLDENGKPYGAFIVHTETTPSIEAWQQVREKDQRLSSILEGSGNAYFEYNIKTKVSEWSERLREILGYHQEEERQEIDFNFFLSLIHPEDRARVGAAVNRTITEGVPYEEEYRIRHRAGHYIYLHPKGKLMTDQHGQPAYVAGIATDVTRWRQIEEELKASEERFRTMAEASGILVAQTDEQGKAVYFNQEWLTLTGRSMPELLNFGWAEFLHPDDREDLIIAYNKAFEKREILKKEFRLLSGEGIYRWQLAVLSPCFSPRGTFTGYVSSCVDVSELKWAEDRLAYQSRLTKIITDNATVGLFMMDAQGRTTYMNPAAEKISGFTFEEARGEVLHDLTHYLHPDGTPFPMEACTIGQAVFSLGQLKNHEDVFIHKDGSFYPVLCSASALYDNDALKGLILEVQDISERKKAEKALEAKNAQLVRINNDLDNFIYTASHDLKAPIHNIEGLVNVLQNNLGPVRQKDSKIKVVMDMMHQSIDKFKATIKDLTEVAKVENSREEEVSEVFFQEILEEVMGNIKSQLEEANATLTVNFEKAPGIHFARKNLRSILYNLVSNAAKYRSPHRPAKISIRTEPYEREYVLLAVQDNGLGIKEADKPKVFTMFKRLHQHVEGTGVGMSIVKRIIENQGGRIELESEVGKGSTFKVYFKNS